MHWFHLVWNKSRLMKLLSCVFFYFTTFLSRPHLHSGLCTLWPKLSGHQITTSRCAFWTSHFKTHVHSYEAGLIFAFIINSTLRGRFSTWFWSLAVWINVHSATRALVIELVIRHWCLVICSGVQLEFQFNPKVFSGVEVRVFCAGHLISSSPTLENHVFVELSLCTEVLSCSVPVKRSYPRLLCASNFVATL